MTLALQANGHASSASLSWDDEGPVLSALRELIDLLTSEGA